MYYLIRQGLLLFGGMISVCGFLYYDNRIAAMTILIGMLISLELNLWDCTSRKDNEYETLKNHPEKSHSDNHTPE